LAKCMKSSKKKIQRRKYCTKQGQVAKGTKKPQVIFKGDCYTKSRRQKATTSRQWTIITLRGNLASGLQIFQ
jgi:hypothetical protein